MDHAKDGHNLPKMVMVSAIIAITLAWIGSILLFFPKSSYGEWCTKQKGVYDRYWLRFTLL